MVLEKIVRHKRAEVAARKPSGFVLSPGQVAPSRRSLERALSKEHTGFILECKKASPSKGLIRADFDPEAIAMVYADFADAISVIADERFFQGSLDYLRTVSNAVDIPVICKDFVVDPYQVQEARQYGADAILLMMSVLDDDAFSACFDATRALSMDALVEVRNKEELDRALRLNARIIGINNRNLDTLQLDIDTTLALSPHVPSDRLVVCESGIHSHGQVRELRKYANGFLVGSALMAQTDLRPAVGELIFGAVKVCGLTRREDALMARQAGVRFGGMIFVDGSPRRVDSALAKEISTGVPLKWVGVFAKTPIPEVIALVNQLGLAAVQLHGNEDNAYIDALRRELPSSVEIWRALQVRDTMPMLDKGAADRILLDGKSGGSGRPFAWSLLDGEDTSGMVIAGGLCPENGASADSIGGFALDVNSGVELSPGVKDAAILNRFLMTLRGKGRQAS